MFKKATKKESRLRLAIGGPSGSGKTWTALAIAAELGKVALLDTERGSASKYADVYGFDVSNVEGKYHPKKVSEAVNGAANAGYDVIVIDSLTHFWRGSGGVLDIHEDECAKTRNSFTAWKKVTPIYMEHIIDAITAAPIHVIATMRAKQEYVLEENDKGKKQPRKVGMAPVMRDDIEFEFDMYATMDVDHNFIVSKSRCDALSDALFRRPKGSEIAAPLKTWLSGEPAEEPSTEPDPPAEKPASEEQLVELAYWAAREHMPQRFRDRAADLVRGCSEANAVKALAWFERAEAEHLKAVANG